MPVVGMGGNLVVMWDIVEPDDGVISLPMKRVFVLRKPDIKESVVYEEDSKVAWRISWPSLDNRVGDDPRVLRECDVSEGPLRL